MRRIAILISAATFAALGAAPGAAAPLDWQTEAAAGGPVEVSAQSRARRARSRIRVTPRHPYRTYHSLYPLPYRYEYPGPYAKRDCAVRYVREHRPSGTVIVPRMNCRWVWR